MMHDMIILTLTYRPDQLPETDKQCLRDWYNFIRRLNRARAKRGLPPAKALCVPDRGGRHGRYHIHAILSGGMSAEELRDVWGKGFVRVAPLEFNDYGMLADYMAEDPIIKKRYLRVGELNEPEQMEMEGG